MNERETVMKSLALQLQTMVELDSSLGISYCNIPSGLEGLNFNKKQETVHKASGSLINDVNESNKAVERPVDIKNRRTSSQVGMADSILSKVSYTGDPERVTRIESLMEQVLECTSCELCKARKNPVRSEGFVEADIAFISSAPGREEDNFGRTFQGAAGQLITDIIEKGMKMPRESVYLSSIIKCRPQGNRDPFVTEIESCIKYLKEEIDIVKPKVIVAVGGAATNILTEQEVSIEQTRGIWYQYNGIPVMPIYHPSFLLRQRRKYGRTNDSIRKTWQDIKQVIARLGE